VCLVNFWYWGSVPSYTQGGDIKLRIALPLLFDLDLP
jgi:hypothetical protein